MKMYRISPYYAAIHLIDTNDPDETQIAEYDFYTFFEAKAALLEKLYERLERGHERIHTATRLVDPLEHPTPEPTNAA